jgi:DNA-binding response OmpR family regulator
MAKPELDLGGGPKILVVDDEPLIADSLALILQDHGYNARAAYSGADALTKAETFTPELLLTDIVMSDLDGIQVAIRLCELWPSCKVLFMSGHVFTSDSKLAEGVAFAFDFAEKPTHPIELLRRIRTLLFAQSEPSANVMEK